MATDSLGMQNFFTTTLSGAISDSDLTVSVNDVPSDSEGYLVIEPDSASKREVIYYTSKTASAVVCPASGGRGADGTSATSHESGAAVEMNFVAGYFDDLQDGTAMADNFLTLDHVGTDSTWVWQDFSPSFSDWTIGTGGSAGTTAKYLQVGKTVFLRIETILGSSGQSVSSNPEFTLPVTAKYGSVDMPISLQCLLNDSNGSQVGGVVTLTDASTARIKYLNAANTEQRFGTVNATSPFTWAAGDSLTFYCMYEAA